MEVNTTTEYAQGYECIGRRNSSDLIPNGENQREGLEGDQVSISVILIRDSSCGWKLLRSPCILEE